jgi:hypothetical protein
MPYEFIDEAGRGRQDTVDQAPPVAPGKVALTARLLPRESEPAGGAPSVQRDAARGCAPFDPDPFSIHLLAAHGVAGGGAPLPHAEAIQQSFGHHDVSGVRAHVGGAAAEAAQRDRRQRLRDRRRRRVRRRARSAPGRARGRPRRAAARRRPPRRRRRTQPAIPTSNTPTPSPRWSCAASRPRRCSTPWPTAAPAADRRCSATRPPRQRDRRAVARVLPERDGPRSRPRLLHAHAHRCDGNPRGARRRARRAVGARPAPRRADRPGQHARIRRRRDRGADRGADPGAHRAAGRARGLDHAHRARPPRRHRDRRSGVLGRGERVAGVRVGLDGPPAGWTAVARGSGTAGARPRARGADCRGGPRPCRGAPAGRRGHHRDRGAARIVERSPPRSARRSRRGVTTSRPRATRPSQSRAGAGRCARPHAASHPRRAPRGRERARRVDQRRAHDPARRHHPARHAAGSASPIGALRRCCAAPTPSPGG